MAVCIRCEGGTVARDPEFIFFMLYRIGPLIRSWWLYYREVDPTAAIVTVSSVGEWMLVIYDYDFLGRVALENLVGATFVQWNVIRKCKIDQ